MAFQFVKYSHNFVEKISEFLYTRKKEPDNFNLLNGLLNNQIAEIYQMKKPIVLTSDKEKCISFFQHTVHSGVTKGIKG